jgi:uncharacterized integral membrane protein
VTSSWTRKPPKQATEPQKSGWQLSPRLVTGAVLLVLAVVFIIENRQPASIRVIVPAVVMPLWAALTGLFLVGFLVGWFVRRRR